MRLGSAIVMALLAIGAVPAIGRADPVRIPVLVPLTGFRSLEGISQRNGALLALRQRAALARADVMDTGTSPEIALNALDRALSGGPVPAVVASMLGTQMLAMMPIAAEQKVPLLTVSGTVRLTELGNPWVFRFFPSDEIAKRAHVRYVVEELGKKRLALIYQTTAYGQGGRDTIRAVAAELGAEIVFEQGIDTDVKDMLPVLSQVRGAQADALLIHLHAGSTALLVRQAAAMGLELPLIAGSAMHQPATAALLEPAELRGVCAEAGSSPVSGGNPAADKFLAEYRAAFGTDPDAYALGQYDGTNMLLDALARGAATPEAVRHALSETAYQGIAGRYASDGKGNMAHSVVILCYDGTSRTPQVVRRYDDLQTAAKP